MAHLSFIMKHKGETKILLWNEVCTEQKKNVSGFLREESIIPMSSPGLVGMETASCKFCNA